MQLCYKRLKKDSWRGPLNSYFTNNRACFIQKKPHWGLVDPDQVRLLWGVCVCCAVCAGVCALLFARLGKYLPWHALARTDFHGVSIALN